MREADTVRLLRATDTGPLERLYASPAFVDATRDRPDLRVVAEPEPVAFADGDLVAPPPTETNGSAPRRD